jgi:hypothetical protein
MTDCMHPRCDCEMRLGYCAAESGEKIEFDRYNKHHSACASVTSVLPDVGSQVRGLTVSESPSPSPSALHCQPFRKP